MHFSYYLFTCAIFAIQIIERSEWMIFGFAHGENQLRLITFLCSWIITLKCWKLLELLRITRNYDDKLKVGDKLHERVSNSFKSIVNKMTNQTDDSQDTVIFGTKAFGLNFHEPLQKSLNQSINTRSVLIIKWLIDMFMSCLDKRFCSRIRWPIVVLFACYVISLSH